MANSSKTELWQQSPRVWAGGSPGMSHYKDTHRPTGKQLCPEWIIAYRGVESLCGFCQWNSGLQFHACLLGHVYIAYLDRSLSSGALAWPASCLIAVTVQISTQLACLPAERRQPRAEAVKSKAVRKNKVLLSPLVSWVQSPSAWVLLLRSNAKSAWASPNACGSWEGRGSAFPSSGRAERQQAARLYRLSAAAFCS